MRRTLRATDRVVQISCRIGNARNAVAPRARCSVFTVRSLDRAANEDDEMTAVALILPLDRVSPVRPPIRDLGPQAAPTAGLTLLRLHRGSRPSRRRCRSNSRAASAARPSRSSSGPLATDSGYGWGNCHGYGWGGWYGGGVAGPGTMLWSATKARSWRRQPSGTFAILIQRRHHGRLQGRALPLGHRADA